MTPPARLQAAIDVLSRWFDGDPIEKALTNWARGARYAGSKDRAAVRDIVFDCLRKRMFFRAQYQLPDDARSLVIAHATSWQTPLSELFTEGGYGPAPLSDAEVSQLAAVSDPQMSPLDEFPPWMRSEIERSLGPDLGEVSAALRERAAVFLRVNWLKSDKKTAQQVLACDEIETRPHPSVSSALEVLSNPRRIAGSRAYKDGLIELQDVASQAVVEQLPMRAENHPMVLDYCAGGGGKSLALAASLRTAVTATDIDVRRMKDIPVRANRADADVKPMAMNAASKAGPFDLVFCDAPCSGSGAWRRNPEGRWRLTAERSQEITKIQSDVLKKASNLVAPNGALAYVTCSFFRSENEDQITRFLHEHPTWRCELQRRFSISEGGDGFYFAYLTQI